ncbi:MAG: bifunctional phosphopantothenoylcysteine decarboxylase/phosphopantothenate--cysteine ligase CoaBC [Abditibacteriaceae bacterium]
MITDLLTGRTIVLAVGGGIAAYKICELASRLTQRGAIVQTILTEGANQFVTPLTFAALTGQPVHSSLWPKDFSTTSGVMASMAHIDLARQADAVLIAPATADLLSKLAHGAADDLLTTLALATKAPVLIAPSMNPAMLQHPATQRNLELVKGLGYLIIDPESGRTACREEGSGRLPETKVLLEALENVLQNVEAASRRLEKQQDAASSLLQNRTILITAGPTREAIDPVRFLGNRSSGKMGYALAEAATAMGAKVLLVSGPTQLQPPADVQLFSVTSTEEMYETVLSHSAQCDIVIAAAAPADFRAAAVAEQKLKKQGTEPFHLQLEPTPDIIASVGASKTPEQIIIGFAAETNDGLENARKKLVSKKLDAIVLNDVTQQGAGFEVDTNQVTWVTSDQDEQWPMMTKRKVAERILERAVNLAK